MTVLIQDVRMALDDTDEMLALRVAEACGVPLRTVRAARFVRRSLDARRKGDIHFRVNAAVEFDLDVAERLLARGTALCAAPEPPMPAPGAERLNGRVVVVGAGPAGLFCALTLAEHGYRPLLVERGRPVGERVRDVERFWRGGPLDPQSNVMFGEGGAGTFSDGKLTARTKDPRARRVLERLSQCGAPADILIDAKPHIGTDRLRDAVSGLRRAVEASGGEVWFSTCLSGLEIANGCVAAVRVLREGAETRVPCGALVLAIGQGARDTYRMLIDAGVAMEPKPFAVGVRIEHPQALIDRAQYGALAGHARLGPADYRLAAQSGGRGVYTFCMCPGGTVVSAASAPEELVVNGMSLHARDGENANAAIVVQVTPADCAAGPLGGAAFAERIERACYAAGGGRGRAPASRAGDYLNRRRPTGFGSVRPTFLPGVNPTDLWDVLPGFVAQGIADGIRAFGRQLSGFDLDDAVLTAPETRTSSPVRITRGADGQSACAGFVYPVGEGAGYAGGIVSAAVDGMRAAERIIERFRADG